MIYKEKIYENEINKETIIRKNIYNQKIYKEDINEKIWIREI